MFVVGMELILYENTTDIRMKRSLILIYNGLKINQNNENINLTNNGHESIIGLKESQNGL